MPLLFSNAILGKKLNIGYLRDSTTDESALSPAQQDLPAMGVLQRVQWAGTSSKTISYNFIHLTIQEMLAAYCISQMGYFKQVRVFQTLH